MTSERPDIELAALFDALAESVADAPPEAVLAEIANGEGNASIEAEKLRAFLLDIVRQFRKRRLERARRAYEAEREQLDGVVRKLPATTDARRKLLQRILAQMPAMTEALLTAQHRDFKSLGDDDVIGCLKQLAALGALDKFMDQGEE